MASITNLLHIFAAASFRPGKGSQRQLSHTVSIHNNPRLHLRFRMHRSLIFARDILESERQIIHDESIRNPLCFQAPEERSEEVLMKIARKKDAPSNSNYFDHHSSPSTR